MIGGARRSIGDYAIIGNSRSAALISRDGALEWLCWPRFDSASWFAALLDPERGGCFSVHPAGPYQATRRYVGDTNVLETTFQSANGVMRLTDLMPVSTEDAKRHALWPEHEILRRMECVHGEVAIELTYAPRPDYARASVALHDRGRMGIFCDNGDEVLVLRAEDPLEISTGSRDARGNFTLRQGESRYISLVFSKREPAVLPPLGAAANSRVDASLAWWTRWIERCQYEGPFRGAVVRSALALKLMTYAPSGAVIAAPTTSLPEDPGGVRNWDYRYCWLRDSSLTLQALLDLGYTAEAASFLSWAIHTTRITWPELQVVYDVYGGAELTEQELTHLAGFANSRPVRIGNGAQGQLQLDIYGEVLDAVYQYVRRGGQLDRLTKRMIVGLGNTVSKRWREPDEGIWEIRAGRRHHTYSKAMCWVALDRLLQLHQAGHVTLPAERFARERADIRDLIEQRGYNDRIGSYVSVLDGNDVDASLLMLARYGVVDPSSPRMRSTLDAIRSRLGANGLLYRYRGAGDGLPGSEGAFGICSFWAVSAQAMAGDVDGATMAFERILSFANDVGLFSEEIDPATGAALGNFPQAFTHVGLIDAALMLAAATRGDEMRPVTGATGRV
jgi:GH15 family glucan-1,4-alpha-glucosidase